MQRLKRIKPMILLLCDDEAHISCSVYSQSSFLYKVSLTEVRVNDLKDTPHDIKTKAQV